MDPLIIVDDDWVFQNFEFEFLIVFCVAVKLWLHVKYSFTVPPLNKAYHCILWECKHILGEYEEHSINDTKRENKMFTSWKKINQPMEMAT